MPLIPQDKLERIKKDIDLVALVRCKGIELKRHGSKDLVGLSPFTKEQVRRLSSPLIRTCGTA